MTKYDIIAATGCPTGIAHTYMAQEALEQAAKKAGVTIKVETHGQIGVENELTPEEIANAKAVIIAADKDVQPQRFVNKKIIDVSVGQGIKNADELVAQALRGEGVVKYHSDDAVVEASEAPQSSNVGKSSIGREIYKHLMNGVSHMLPFVVGGGVLIAISFAVFGIYSFDPNHETYNAFSAQLKEIGGLAMGLMTPVLAAYIAQSIGNRPALVSGFVAGLMASNGGAGFLGGIVGGFFAGYLVVLLEKLFKALPKALDGLKAIFLYPLLGVLITGLFMSVIVSPMADINQSLMVFLKGFQDSNPILLGLVIGCMCAFDMGGPVNKAAYVTGTVLLGEGNTVFMAGVSAACIAPPLITTVAVLLFKNRFDTNERNAGLVNFILGSTHITEGAIPFVAKDPLRAMPSMMLGSSIAAILTYLFGVQVPAPHGGFLVLPVVTHPFLWVLAIAIGSVVGGVVLGATRKPLSE
ncbi:PTS fructose transporter subunit IIBC [uncultured Granulicatella sp.]|uniref:PTS fructose transporter subunit IIC n=1 Tax=uncultured Granulicatella sp. TaxID=316089 RepID=UPI002602B159|nr:PTS fructose transporter subunit IIBC [uncultured Granulicatella sp.]